MTRERAKSMWLAAYDWCRLWGFEWAKMSRKRLEDIIGKRRSLKEIALAIERETGVNTQVTTDGHALYWVTRGPATLHVHEESLAETYGSLRYGHVAVVRPLLFNMAGRAQKVYVLGTVTKAQLRMARLMDGDQPTTEFAEAKVYIDGMTGTIADVMAMLEHQTEGEERSETANRGK